MVDAQVSSKISKLGFVAAVLVVMIHADVFMPLTLRPRFDTIRTNRNHGYDNGGFFLRRMGA